MCAKTGNWLPSWNQLLCHCSFKIFYCQRKQMGSLKKFKIRKNPISKCAQLTKKNFRENPPLVRRTEFVSIHSLKGWLKRFKQTTLAETWRHTRTSNNNALFTNGFWIKDRRPATEIEWATQWIKMTGSSKSIRLPTKLRSPSPFLPAVESKYLPLKSRRKSHYIVYLTTYLPLNNIIY